MGTCFHSWACRLGERVCVRFLLIYLKMPVVYPLQSFCLENPMDGGAWWAAVHGV